ncbi:YbaN family protein [Xinfangfangia sp. D13-10-4-6]|uniref:YbaN family protein n=1 Tax=Pseudogemmobacter hezensis TaxID=2737662 RepID=UPI00155383F5|nr:YbaN family protein [Pseudogemmobacter hezensis]NPD16477.1 YbaN family protein [Pseudogemmobacter hezensis]
MTTPEKRDNPQAAAAQHAAAVRETAETSDEAVSQDTALTPPGTPLSRALFLLLGLFFTGLGFVGALLPVLPTVPFLILAVACFTRSSTRLERWLLAHPQFGPLLRDWREKGAIPRRAKWMAAGGMALGFALFVLGSQPGWPLIALVLAVMGYGLYFVWSRPDA